MIAVKESFAYWNYFIALEEDLYKISRFIEFNEDNFETYSIELAKLLISASSQVDVILRDICSKHSNKQKDSLNITDYIPLVEDNFKWIIEQKIKIFKFNMNLHPFENLKKYEKVKIYEPKQKPCWWTAYTDVKHNMNTKYNRANLKNVLNAMGALFSVVRTYYSTEFHNIAKKDIKNRQSFLNLSQAQQKSILFSTEQGERGPYP